METRQAAKVAQSLSLKMKSFYGRAIPWKWSITRQELTGVGLRCYLVRGFRFLTMTDAALNVLVRHEATAFVTHSV